MFFETMTALDDLLSDSELTDPNKQVIAQLIQIVEEHIDKRDLLQEEVDQKQNNLRNILVELEREKVYLKKNNALIQECNDRLRKMIPVLEGRIYKLQDQIDNLIYKLNNAYEAMQNMQQELKHRDRQLKQHLMNKQKIIERCNATIQAETDRMAAELETKLQKQCEQLERCIKKKDDKLKLMKQILITKSEDATCDISMISTAANTKMDIMEEPDTTLSSKLTITEELIPTTFKEKPSAKLTAINTKIPSTSAIANTAIMKKIPVVNPRYWRSQNANKWIKHFPTGIVPTGTILQPEIVLSKQTCVTKLTNPKTFTTKALKYCLYSQEQDTDGELEIKLYKADVLPTSGGGAQIVFNDIECLKQMSPTGIRRHYERMNPESSSARI